MDTSEIVVSSIRAGMKREFAFMMKAQSEMGGLPAGRRVTRSQRGGRSSRGYALTDIKFTRRVKGSASKKPKKNEEEKPERDDVKLGPGNVLEGDNGEERGVVDTVSSMVDCSRNLDADLVAALDNEAEEKAGPDSREGVVQSLCTVLPVAQVGGSSRVSTHEDDRILGSASDLGCESTGDGTSMALEKPLRRFTRSALKMQDGSIELESGAGAVESMTTSPSKLEMKMSKKVGLKRVPIKLRELLETGLLEGLHVRYINGSKGRRRPETELQGVIKGTGLLCSCDECEGKKVVTPNQFELHAHSGNKRPPEYIYLENGKSLRDVLNACKANLSDSLEAVIQNAIGRSNYTTAFCLNCRGLIPEAGAGRAMLLCDSCVLPKESYPSQTQVTDVFQSSPIKETSVTQPQSSPIKETSVTQPQDVLLQELEPKPSRLGRSPLVGSPVPTSSSSVPEVLYDVQISSNSQPRVKCQGKPEVLDSFQVSSNSQPQVRSQGKLTRKDLRMHKSVLAEDLLPDGTALSYVMHGKIRLEGYKKDSAIFCFCCKKVVSPSQFEAHAGFASRRKPYMSIYTSNGVSLHQLSLELSRSRKSSTEENDDLCSICEDGGDLLCCENCPRAFHTECVGLPTLPQGIWYCKYCENMFEKEKFSENDANAIAAGRVPGVDPLEDITKRCIRIVANVQKYTGGGCIVCRVDIFSKSGFNDNTVMICDQCEREYHVKCLREKEIDDLKALPETEWFCSKQCSSIHSTLQKMIGDGERKLPEAILNILEKKGDGQGSCEMKGDGQASQEKKVDGEDSQEKKGDGEDSQEKQDDGEGSQEKKSVGECSQEMKCNGEGSPEKKGNGEGSQEKNGVGECSQEMKCNGEGSPEKKGDGEGSQEKKSDGEGSQQNPKLDIRWRLLRGKVSSEDTRVWLSGAVTIFHDRFDPIADASTSRLDLIPTMVYGRKFKDQEFYGMYCAILTIGSAVVCAAIVRVFGEEVAELPLVATRSDCQGKGYFQALFACVEELLMSLNVKDLVLPAADEAESLWKNRFGFEKLEQEKLDEYKKSYQLMIFEGTSILHKSMSKS